MKKLILFLMIIFSLQLISSSQSSIGTYEIGSCIDLPQTCSNCTFNNITTIIRPNGTDEINNVMTKDETHYNYTYCNTETLGNYFVNGIGDDDGITTVWVYSFEVTTTGFRGIQSGEGTLLSLVLGGLLVVSILFFITTLKVPTVGLKVIFGGLSALFIFIFVLFSLVSVSDLLSGYPNLLEGYTTVLMVIRVLVFIGVLTLVLFGGLMALRLWNYKRGRLD